ncbi:MAG: alkaline phosphatase D family protein [Planctomycetota bacterium]
MNRPVPTRALRAALAWPLLLVLMSGLACQSLVGRAGPGDGYRSRFEGLPDRPWIGPEFWANRLQDWRLAQGRAECVEAGPKAALRTLHLVTHRTVMFAGDAAREGSFRATVRLGAIEEDLPLGETALAGFLIGAGNERVDHRLSAQVFGAPGEDGGLLAIVDGAGQVALRDLSHGSEAGGLWSIPMGTTLAELPLLEGVQRSGAGFAARAGGGHGPVDLELVAGRFDGRTFVTLVARAIEDGGVLSTATLEGVDPGLLDGAFALVSHRGPEGGQRGFWFDRLTLDGDLVVADKARAFGPILCAQYSIDETQPRGGTLLSLTAQMPQLGPRDTRTATLEIKQRGGWQVAARAELYEDSETFQFRVPGFDASRPARYRVVYDLVTGVNRTERAKYEGALRVAPTDGDFVVADVGCVKHFTGGLRWNERGLWFPHAEVVDAVLAHDPDLVYFSGDQLYEGDITAPVRQPHAKAMGDYLTRWYRWCWSFRELCRDRPCITVPDDHDVYHGNIWGNAGVRGPETVATPEGGQEKLTLQDRGGYTMSPRFVNAVHRTQVSHLPPAHTPEPLGSGIAVYHTDVTWGGVSFAVLADRMFKSSPSVTVPEGRVRNGWFRNEAFDPRDADVPGAQLLGPRQLAFLDDWAVDWSGGAWVKVALSQTPFANIATLPKGGAENDLPTTPLFDAEVYPDGETLGADCDSGGWPQTPRNEALRRFRLAAAIHLAGDQHLASTIRYGIDAFDDAGYCLTAPAVGNTWPRRWFPAMAAEGRADADTRTPRNLGRFLDGFGNHMTVLAVANPRRSGVEPAALHDRVPGYGILRLSRAARTATVEAWPRHVDPRADGTAPYAGWPITFPLEAGDGREVLGHLPELELGGPWVVQVEREVSDGGRPNEVLYTRRVAGPKFAPPVFSRGARYTVRVDPDGPVPGGAWAFERRGVAPGPGSLMVDLARDSKK